MTNPSDALRVVVGLAEKATPGPWAAEGADVSAHHVAADPRLQYWVCEDVNGDSRHRAISGRPTDNAKAIVTAVNFIREHGAALARALEDSARLDFVLEQLGADEASALFSNKEMTPEEVRVNIDIAIAAQQKEAANGD